MLNIQEAEKIVYEVFPKGKIQAVVSYKDLYLFQVFTDRPFEENWDPFYSVNKATGEFRDFSVITDGNTSELVSLFVQAKKNNSSTLNDKEK